MRFPLCVPCFPQKNSTVSATFESRQTSGDRNEEQNPLPIKKTSSATGKKKYTAVVLGLLGKGKKPKPEKTDSPDIPLQDKSIRNFQRTQNQIIGESASGGLMEAPQLPEQKRFSAFRLSFSSTRASLPLTAQQAPTSTANQTPSAFTIEPEARPILDFEKIERTLFPDDSDGEWDPSRHQQNVTATASSQRDVPNSDSNPSHWIPSAVITALDELNDCVLEDYAPGDYEPEDYELDK